VPRIQLFKIVCSVSLETAEPEAPARPGTARFTQTFEYTINPDAQSTSITTLTWTATGSVTPFCLSVQGQMVGQTCGRTYSASAQGQADGRWSMTFGSGAAPLVADTYDVTFSDPSQHASPVTIVVTVANQYSCPP
jgi:hypothetical protein